MSENPFDASDIISSYTRREMIENGDLIDVTDTAREAGIRYPTAITAGAWQHCVAVPPGVTGQDEKGRCWDVLFMLASTARGRPATPSTSNCTSGTTTASAPRPWCSSRPSADLATTPSPSSP